MLDFLSVIGGMEWCSAQQDLDVVSPVPSTVIKFHRSLLSAWSAMKRCAFRDCLVNNLTIERDSKGFQQQSRVFVG